MTITRIQAQAQPLTDSRWFRPALGLAGLLALGLSASGEEGPVLCPFRICTGGYCPGCGFTRSTGALIRGDVAGSWRHHPYLLLVAVQAAVLVTVWSIVADPVRAKLRNAAQPLLIANAILVATIWIVRILSGQIPAPFFN